MAEAHFMLRSVRDPVEKFLVVLTALSKEQADRVKAIVEAEPSATSYTAICNALVFSHSLTLFQQIDRPVNMELLGHCKPTRLLAAMAKFSPAEDHHFFAYHFLQRLLREVPRFAVTGRVQRHAGSGGEGRQPYGSPSTPAA
jgi:hypothetical protein